MAKVVVLGAGMVGRAIALDMRRRANVTVVDIRNENLDRLRGVSDISLVQADLTLEKEVAGILTGADLVISAVPGAMGFETLKRIIVAGRNVVDISFFPEDAFELDQFARAKNVTAVVDCGVAPGLSNLLLGYYNRRMEVSDFVCYVGGLPVERRLPFEYKAPFSPADVIEEYLRPARFVRNGQVIVKEALTDPEWIDVGGVGTLEAFNTDGLRSLLRTMKVPNMLEKTLRYPGHIEKIQLLKRLGFFSDKEIGINGKKVVPLALTSQLLFREWQLQPEEAELTIMRIVIRGRSENWDKTVTFNLLDRYDPVTGQSSMARTTGYTCTAVANLMLDGQVRQAGICPPEFIGEDAANMRFILDYLNARNIQFVTTEG
ncbi:MAG: saccharopine dehydrogenase family protein [Fidelibacterota bacterium]